MTRAQVRAPRYGQWGRVASFAAAWALAGGVAIVAAASIRTPVVEPGGIYRVGWEGSFGFTNSFDPTGEYAAEATAIFSNLMVRTLVGYNHVSGPAGNRLVADIAVGLPTPTDGGRTYRFRLKKGIRFGPPLNRPVTARDVRYAIERLARPKNGAQYGFYYDVIRGLPAFRLGKASSIAGISTPDERTIVFRLTEPTGDFLYRLALPAAGAIPVEVAGCFDGMPGRYGRNVVSTGPYMIAGSGDVDASSCAKVRPASGFDGETTLRLVRNPNYEPTTDSPAARANLPDEFLFTVNANPRDILDKVAANELHDEVATIPPQVLARYTRQPALRQFLHRHSADGTFYLSMNLTQPPFDDVRVRKAMNWIMDKAALLQAGGGPTAGAVAHHIIPGRHARQPPRRIQPVQDSRRPRQPREGEGRAARLEVRRQPRWHLRRPAVQGGAADRRDAGAEPPRGARDRCQREEDRHHLRGPQRQRRGPRSSARPRRNIPFVEFTGWSRTTRTRSRSSRTAVRRALDRRDREQELLARGARRLCRDEARDRGERRRVASVNAQLDRCAALTARPRLACYERLDRMMMTRVVPWIPYKSLVSLHITSRDVTQWQFDQRSRRPPTRTSRCDSWGYRSGFRGCSAGSPIGASPSGREPRDAGEPLFRSRGRCRHGRSES